MNLSLPVRRLSVRRELWLLGRLRWQLARNSLRLPYASACLASAAPHHGGRPLSDR